MFLPVLPVPFPVLSVNLFDISLDSVGVPEILQIRLAADQSGFLKSAGILPKKTGHLFPCADAAPDHRRPERIVKPGFRLLLSEYHRVPSCSADDYTKPRIACQSAVSCAGTFFPCQASCLAL